MAVEAAAATDYAVGLRTRRHDPTLHELIENNLKRALELWYHAGQLAAMPQLLDSYRGLRPAVRPDMAALPGGARFDPWCLTDPATRARWQRDPRAVQAIGELWQWDPDPAAADDMPRGLPFRRGILLGPFRMTEEVEYCDPDGRHVQGSH
jgi:hypothetical protein